MKKSKSRHGAKQSPPKGDGSIALTAGIDSLHGGYRPFTHLCSPLAMTFLYCVLRRKKQAGFPDRNPGGFTEKRSKNPSGTVCPDGWF
ncbi:hypothetical protein JXO59_04115 [candidate division KSB1 bacterium]|nr:hypothetical protein [candidate division KSB1 bacterium]